MSRPSNESAAAAGTGRSLATPQLLDRLLYLALILCCGMALSKGLADPDFWGHVQYGRDVLADGLPDVAQYTYTAVGHRWINHENLAEIAFAAGVDTLGPACLLLLKSVAGMATLALILWRARRAGVGQVAAFTAVMLVAANMMLFWTLRPQLFSFLYFVLLLVLLDHAFHRWTPAKPQLGRIALRLSPVVPLMAAWTNTHGGFLAGYCVLVAYLGLRGLEGVAATFRKTAAPGGRTADQADGVHTTLHLRPRRLLATAAVFGGIVLAAGAATLLNPYGVELHQWLLASLGEPRPEIIEWRRPEFTVPWIPFWLIAAAVVAAAAGTRRPRDWVHFAVVGLTLWQAASHRRHVVFLALLFGFWMLPHWDSVLKRLGIGRDESSIGESLQGLPRKLFAGGLAAALVLLTANLAMQLRQIPVRHDNYPVDAFQFIADQQLRGRLLVQLRWGQYAIAAFGQPMADGRPQLEVAFDGRFRTCYPQRVVDQYFDFMDGEDAPLRNRSPDSPPPDDTAIVCGAPRPDFVLIDRKLPNPTRVMRQQLDEWVLLYQDSLCRFYGRRDLCDSPASPNFVPQQARVVDSLPLAEVTPWPALPQPPSPARLVSNRSSGTTP